MYKVEIYLYTIPKPEKLKSILNDAGLEFKQISDDKFSVEFEERKEAQKLMDKLLNADDIGGSFTLVDPNAV